MSIRDQSRSRKTYSFFRTKPVISVDTETSTTIISGDGDMLIFSGVANMSAYDASASDPGQLAFVQTLRDYFFFQSTVNSGSADTLTRVAATPSGRWYRMGLGGAYWKNQEEWYIDSEVGHDENLGSSDKPIKTLDEIGRRFLNTEKLSGEYSVIITSVTQSVENLNDLNIVFEKGGSLVFTGVPKVSSSLATLTFLSAAVNYTAGTAPAVFYTGSIIGSPSQEYLYVSGTGISGFQFLGWALTGSSGVTYTTPFTQGRVGNSIYKALIPSFQTKNISVDGHGTVQFEDLRLGQEFEEFNIHANDHASVQFSRCDLKCTAAKFVGGNIVLNNSRVFPHPGANETVLIDDYSDLKSTNSGLVPNAVRGIINVKNSNVELGSSIFWNSDIVLKSSKMIMSTLALSGCALASSSVEVQSDCTVDVRNLIATASAGIPNPVKITGQNVTVFFDDNNQPKANNIAINNGTVTLMSWSSTPYQDLLRHTRVVSGSLQNIL